MCLNCERLGKTCPGYNQERRWVDQTNKTANQYGMTLYARSATPPSTIREINPARMHDEALVALIDTLYAPRDGINRTEWAFLGRLSNIPNWAPPLRAALQAAATAQAATVSQTQELDVEAKTYNGHAIRALSQSLVRTNYAPVHTAAAAMILAFTQYLGVITGGTSAWRTHIMG